MENSHSLLRFWLRNLSERGVDILAIVLVSCGINIFTGGSDKDFGVFIKLSGAAITIAGVIMARLKHHTDLIRRSVESNIARDTERLKERLKSGGESAVSLGKDSGDYLDKAIDDFVGQSAKTRDLTRQLTLAIVLAVGGFGSVFIIENLQNKNAVVASAHFQEAIDKLYKEIVTVQDASLTENRKVADGLKSVEAMQTNIVSVGEQISLLKKEVAELHREINRLSVTGVPLKTNKSEAKTKGQQ